LELRPILGSVQDITSEKMEEAMLKMKMGKAAGPSGVPIKVIRISGLESVLA